MKRVRREELLDPEAYERSRAEIRAAVLEEKRLRRVHVAGVLTFLFENAATARYQILEMIRVEGLRREEEIRHELDTYNELLGGKGEVGVSLLIEIPDPAERDRRLREWLALPAHVYLKVDGGEKVLATYDPRQVGDDRLSAVQYLKFDLRGRTPVAAGCDLPGLTGETALEPPQQAAIARDLASDS
ncbi:MAG TPA: DUF3501 family protein [Anaeromyxobacteraceae bacterium]|nr:DUF3501 family protein [Anaeromyxobacteraceae bacterium]